MVCSGRIELRSWEYGLLREKRTKELGVWLFIESRTKEWRIGFV